MNRAKWLGVVITTAFIIQLVSSGIAFPQVSRLATGFYLPSRDLGGYRQFQCVEWKNRNCISYHLGVDRRAPEGDPVYALGNGVIEWYSDDVCGFLGYKPDLPGGAMVIRYESTEGAFYALYGHIKNPLKIAGRVTAGEQIAEIGPTYTDPGNHYQVTHKGCYTSKIVTYGYKNYLPHLHFGIYTGKTVPRTYLGYNSSPGNWKDPIKYLKMHYPAVAHLGPSSPERGRRGFLPEARIISGIRYGVNWDPSLGWGCFPRTVGGEIYSKIIIPPFAIQGSVGKTTAIKCAPFGVEYWQLGIVTAVSPLYVGVLIHVNEWALPRLGIIWLGAIAGVEIPLHTRFFPRGIVVVEGQLWLPNGDWFAKGAIWGTWFVMGFGTEF